MKKHCFYLIFTLLLFMRFLAFGQWDQVGNLERIKVSDTTILQYVISKDGKSIYVLDQNYILRKFDVGTGTKVWSKNLRPSDSTNKTFYSVSIGQEGENYVIWHKLPSHPERSLFYFRDIETDSLLAILDYQLNSELGNIYSRIYSFDSEIQLYSNYLFYIGRYFLKGSKYELYSGFLLMFKIGNDSIFAKKIWGTNFGYSGYIFFNPTAKILVYSCYSLWVNGPIMGKFEFGRSHDFKLFDIEKNSTIDLLKHIPNSDEVINNFVLSKDGNILWLNYGKRLCIIQTKQHIKINEIKFSEPISQILPCDKKDLLLITNGNNILIFNSKLLLPIDTINIKIEKNIFDLKFSPSEDTLYFHNGNEIYRFDPNLLSPFKAFFYTNTIEAIVGDTVKFFDFSSGNPDSYFWDFGDGNTSNEKNPIHIYRTHGYFKAKLITIRKGEISEYDTTITVSPYLLASFHYVKDESTCPVFVRFQNTSIGSRIDSVLWDFGEYYSSISREFNPTYQYKLSDEYEVTLKIYGMKNTSSVKKKIKINVPQVPLIQEDFRYEINFPSFAGSVLYSAIELPNRNILAIKDNSNTQSLISFDSTGKILWEKQNLKGFLITNPYNNAIFLINGSKLMEIDTNGNIIREFEDPDKARIGNIFFEPSKICYGSGKIWREGEQESIVKYECYYTELQDDLIGRDCLLYPAFKVTERKILDKGSDTLQKMYLSGSTSQYTICSELDAKVFKLNNDNFVLILSLFAFNAALSWQSDILVQKTPIIMYTKINGKKIENFTTNIKKSGPLYCGYILSPKEQSSVIRLNDSIIVLLVLDVNYYYRNPVVWLYDIKNMELKHSISLSINPTSLIRINNNHFAVAGFSSEIFTLLILNHKGEVKSNISTLCRYGKLYDVSITLDKQLLLSGGRHLDRTQGNIQQFPYLLKTNFSFLPQMFSPFLHSSIEVNSPPTYSNSLIFPNPTNGKFSLMFETLFVPCKIEIINTMGVVVQTLFESRITSEKLEFDISDVPQGIYFIKITLPNAIKIQKIIKVDH